MRETDAIADWRAAAIAYEIVWEREAMDRAIEDHGKRFNEIVDLIVRHPIYGKKKGIGNITA